MSICDLFNEFKLSAIFDGCEGSSRILREMIEAARISAIDGMEIKMSV